MLFGWALRIMSLDDEFGEIKLSDTITFILRYHSTHFNEKGEYWGNYYDMWNNEIEYWFGYDAKEYQEKMNIKTEMKRFFEHQKINTLNPESVKKFLEEKRITDAILFYCSRPGESS